MDRSTVGMDCDRRVIPSFLDFGDPSGTMPTLDETLSLADLNEAAAAADAYACSSAGMIG